MSISSTERMIRSIAIGSFVICAAACKRQAGGEQPLDDVVVQIPGDALALVEQPGGASHLVEAGVLDGQPGGRGQADRELLVDIGEHLTVGLVGQVQVAEDDAAQADRHAEERRHRRMVRWESEAVRMGVQVGEPQRLGFQDQQTENPVAFGSRTDAGGLLLVDPDGDELGQTRPGFIEHTQRRVLCIDQIGGCFGDPPQNVGKGLLGADRHDGVEQAEQLFRAGELEAMWHPNEVRARHG